MIEKTELEGAIEAILFVSDAPVTAIALLNILTAGGYVAEMGAMDAVLDGVIGLKNKCLEAENGFELREIGGGYQLLTKEKYTNIVKLAIAGREGKRLSKAALEVLAIVAYKQPVMRSEIDFIRGVASDYAVGKLLEKGLIEISGRAEMPGSPLLYRTTGAFMEYFGLNSLVELPRLEDFKTDEEKVSAAFLGSGE